MIDIAAAAERLSPYARPTPLVRALLLSRELGCELLVKNETVSPVASFKWRGALNAILRETGVRGVVTSSTGNHGQGVAWAARMTGVPAHIFLPLGANPTKRAKIEFLGATIHDAGYDLDAAKALAIAFAQAEGLTFVDDGDSEGVIEGTGTIGLEIAAELDGIDVVYVPMGSGSLASGIAMGMKQFLGGPRRSSEFLGGAQPLVSSEELRGTRGTRGTRIVAVQSSGSPAMVESFHARRAIERPIDSVADGLACRVPAQLALDLLLQWVDDAVIVPDSEILAAARAMALGAHLLVEPSGAAGLAAALRDHMRGNNIRGKRVVVIATGSNITPELLRSIVD